MEFLQQVLDAAWHDYIYWEFTAFILGVLSVWFARLENIWVFPTGIVSVLIYVFICFHYKLYADMGINAYYFIMSLYGWYMWSRKEESIQLPITYNTRQEYVWSAIMLVGFYILFQYSLTHFTDSDVPSWDAFTTSFALVGMWLMARKKIEHWIAWIITDLISIPLYIYKGLYISSFQFFIFLILAISGWFAWKKKYPQQKSIALSK